MDIKQIVIDLQNAGLSQSEIGIRAGGLSQSSISDIASGKIGQVRPAYSTVTALTQLHKRVMRSAKKKAVEAQ